MAFQICKKDIHRQEEENMFDIEYGGITADSLEVKISERPHIPTPKKDANQFLFQGEVEI